MYKIRKDDNSPDKFRLQYYMANNFLDPLYTIENLSWEDTERFIKGTTVDHNDLLWIHDLVRLLDKQVSLTDSGDWSIL